MTCCCGKCCSQKSHSHEPTEYKPMYRSDEVICRICGIKGRVREYGTSHRGDRGYITHFTVDHLAIHWDDGTEKRVTWN